MHLDHNDVRISTMRSSTRRSYAALATGATFALLLGACAPSSSEVDADSPEIDCAAFDEFGDLDGKTVSVYTSIVEPEQQTQVDSYKPFEECTGVTIAYEGSREFEAQLLVRLKAGNVPDIAYLPQPGLLKTIVEDTGLAVAAPEAVSKNVDTFFSESWKGYGSVDGTFYAAPLGANMKSYVWYSPKMFKDAGYEVPETWDDMMAITDKIVAEGEIPWCAGIGSGDATGWPATDWVEDVVLRTAGPEVYDQWVAHEIPFNDPQIVDALDTVASVLKNPAYVNAGLGDVTSIATTEWDGAGNPILDGNCWMHRAANFYQTQWPEGTTVAEDGDVFAFYLPSMSADVKPILGGGEFVTAFSDRPEVQAFQTYLSSADWANTKAIVTPDGGWVSANNGLDVNNLATDFDKLSSGLLADPNAVIRFDASDLMPGSVGAGTFWTEMVKFFSEDKSSQAVADSIEASWPQS